MPFAQKRALPRLSKGAYKGSVSVFWTHSIENRQTGWLDLTFHLKFRELLCHSLSRYKAICPVYCLMPDHLHLLVTSIDDASDQLQLNRFLRQELNKLLGPFRLQSQACDHVLRRNESDREAFQSIAHYILENPVRKEICTVWTSYPYSGSSVPGYFDLDPRKDGYWELLWRIYSKLAQ